MPVRIPLTICILVILEHSEPRIITPTLRLRIVVVAIERRNVKDFGAVGDGVIHDTAAINQAASAFSQNDTATLHCGDDCVGLNDDTQPNIVLDNLLIEDTESVVLVAGGNAILEGSLDPLYFNSWASGYPADSNGPGARTRGFISPAPRKPPSLLDDNGVYFTRLKLQSPKGTPIIASEKGVWNNATGTRPRLSTASSQII
ncbi:hypothetical protein BJX99DRAFT_256293 [Aspergillus californicus]